MLVRLCQSGLCLPEYFLSILQTKSVCTPVADDVGSDPLSLTAGAAELRRQIGRHAAKLFAFGKNSGESQKILSTHSLCAHSSFLMVSGPKREV